MKRWMALFLTAVMAFSLAACSVTEENGGGVEETVKIEEKFDANGNILIQPVYMGWNLWYYNDYTYDAAGRLTNKKYCHYSGDVINEWKYIYGESGTLEMVEEYVGTTLASEEIYDEYGLLYKKQNYNTSGIAEDYYIFEYDSQGRCIEQRYYSELWDEWNEWTAPVSYVLYTYDNEGNCVRKEKLDKNEELVYYWTYTYDGLENVTVEKQVQVRDGKEYATVTEYTYHDNGRVKTKIMESDTVRTAEDWDASGALVCEEHYEPSGSRGWFLRYSAEYSGDTKVWTDYMKNGKYTVQTMNGNAEATNWTKTAYYNADDTLFCTYSDGAYYDAAGNKMSDSPDISAWTE